ncbi:hypothetical protein PVAP13_9KG033957 [Panicum virgatum]|uniref:DUF7595 domain-containing protein n=1 Tax=Panicum virgatum TaxID=38727 RepID=A0A8T0NI90_PANVG|nr:hypothetical protein PVAP13_9KG033957 [Panicum virgatum]
MGSSLPTTSCAPATAPSPTPSRWSPWSSAAKASGPSRTTPRRPVPGARFSTPTPTTSGSPGRPTTVPPRSISNNAPDYSPGDERYLTHTVAVDVTTGQARVTKLPKQCLMRDEDVSCKRVLMLATSEDDRLSLVRREEASLEVSVWLYVGDHGGGGGPEKSGWLLRRSIDIRKLIEEAGLSRFRLGCKDWEVLEIRLEWFCPRSRSMILWIPYLGLLVLDPEGKRIQIAADDSHGHIWPYEIDLTLCLCSMKTF